jgi:hypothetical protein
VLRELAKRGHLDVVNLNVEREPNGNEFAAREEDDV